MSLICFTSVTVKSRLSVGLVILVLLTIYRSHYFQKNWPTKISSTDSLKYTKESITGKYCSAALTLWCSTWNSIKRRWTRTLRYKNNSFLPEKPDTRWRNLKSPELVQSLSTWPRMLWHHRAKAESYLSQYIRKIRSKYKATKEIAMALDLTKHQRKLHTNQSKNNKNFLWLPPYRIN